MKSPSRSTRTSRSSRKSSNGSTGAMHRSSGKSRSSKRFEREAHRRGGPRQLLLLTSVFALALLMPAQAQTPVTAPAEPQAQKADLSQGLEARKMVLHVVDVLAKDLLKLTSP